MGDNVTFSPSTGTNTPAMKPATNAAVTKPAASTVPTIPKELDGQLTFSIRQDLNRSLKPGFTLTYNISKNNMIMISVWDTKGNNAGTFSCQSQGATLANQPVAPPTWYDPLVIGAKNAYSYLKPAARTVQSWITPSTTKPVQPWTPAPTPTDATPNATRPTAADGGTSTAGYFSYGSQTNLDLFLDTVSQPVKPNPK